MHSLLFRVFFLLFFGGGAVDPNPDPHMFWLSGLLLSFTSCPEVTLYKYFLI